MGPEDIINCTMCGYLAGDLCTFHDVELDNPAFTLCGQFRMVDEPPDSMPVRFPLLQELAPGTIYEVDPAGEVTPLLQVARKRRARGRTTGILPPALEGLPEVEQTAPGIDRADRFAGALLGIGVGDALGFPAEGRSPAEIEMIYGGPITGYLARIGRRHTWPVGQVSKDTQLTLLLGESLVAEKRLDMDDLAERLVKWLPNALRAGKSTLQGVQALAEGRHWSVSGVASNGSGATLRAVPLALRWHKDYTMLRQEAVLQAMATHAAPRAYAGTVLFATAVAALVNTPAGQLNRTEFFGLLERAIRGMDAEMSGRLQEIAAMLADGVSAKEALTRFRTGGYIMECLPSALYCFLAHRDDPETALLTAANGGFDATTVAGMTGALIGAYHGRRGLPGRFVQELPVAPALQGLADQLLALVLEREAAPA